jgi:hypothetical protein
MQFANFTLSRFGLRVQHILHDQTRRPGFLNVNGAFKPHIVVFNNRHWRPGDFTDFQAEAFYFLEGAVDVESLAPDPQNITNRILRLLSLVASQTRTSNHLSKRRVFAAKVSTFICSVKLAISPSANASW